MENCIDYSNSRQVSILGSDYLVNVVPYESNDVFERRKISGYCDYYNRCIVVCDPNTKDDWKDETGLARNRFINETIRHEIVHAFLYESGFSDASMNTTDGWSNNEEMIDWFAIQGPKIVEVWKLLDCF